MKESYILNEKPLLKFILSENTFEIIDNSKMENNDSYKYKDLEEVLLKKEKTNWLISILSLIFDISTGSATGKKFKDKPFLFFKFRTKILKIWLIDSDILKAEKMTIKLNYKLQYLSGFKT